MRKPPVPIPNTVVKTHSGENTWRATAWEDSSLPTPNLRKRELNASLVLFFCSLKIVHEAKKLDKVKSKKATKTPSVTKCKDEF